jgi:type I restriction enzyme S subunit
MVKPRYLLWLMKSQKYQSKIKSMTKSTAKASINMHEIRQLPLIIPSIKEQEMIIIILDLIEEKLLEEIKHSNHLFSVKKGLMQILLLGNVRVKLDEGVFSVIKKYQGF